VTESYTAHRQVGEPAARGEIQDRHRAGARDGRVPDVGGEHPPAPRIERQPVGPDLDVDLGHGAEVVRREEPHGVLTAVRRDDQVGRRHRERPRHRAQAAHRAHVLPRRDVEDVHGVVGGMGDVDPAARLVHGGVIEAARSRVGREIDEALPPQRHG
jgi:hypothetical protein